MRSIRIASLIIALTVLPIGTFAATITADLVYSNVLPDGTLYGQVTVSSLDTQTVQFYVDVFTPPLVKGGDNYGIKTFGFNMNPDFTIDGNHRLKFIGPSDWEFSEDKNISEFGVFDIRYTGPGDKSQDPLVFSLMYKTRTNSSSPWVYQLLSPENFFDENNKDFNFVAHVIDIHTGLFESSDCGGSKEITSAYFADGEIQTPVPEPGTMILLGSGLVGLAGWGRKKFRK